MVPYRTVHSGTCESNGMQTVLKRDECVKIKNALNKIGFVTKVKDEYNDNARKYADYLNTWHSLVLPFGCLFNDNGYDALLWNPPLEFQENIPCGSIWNGHKYYCFCKK